MIAVVILAVVILLLIGVGIYVYHSKCNCANKLGFTYTAKNNNVATILNQLQNVFASTQQYGCVNAKQFWNATKAQFLQRLTDQFSLNPTTTKCDVARSTWKKSIDDAGRTNLTQMLNATSIANSTNPAQSSTAAGDTLITKLKPVLEELGNQIITSVCDGGNVSPTKVVQLMDDLLNSICI
jgi:hypothetical protein